MGAMDAMGAMDVIYGCTDVWMYVCMYVCTVTCLVGVVCFVCALCVCDGML